ncbi:putative ribonuclease H-like domain-containing protein [Tanacetum coccineum]
MAKQVELNKQKVKSTGQWENRPVWNNVQRLNHQNKFVLKAVLAKTGKFPINAARQNLSSQAAATSTARKVNIARPIMNEIRPRNNFYKSHSPIRRPFNRTTVPKANFTNHKVNTAGDKTVSAVGGNRETADDLQKDLKNKGIVDSGCSRHMTGNKAYLVEQRAKFLHDTIAAQRKFLAEQRAIAIKNKPLTKTQLRNQMITFLKHVGRYTHSKLRNKKFDEVQVLYEKAKKYIQDFVPIGSTEDERLIEKMNKKAASEDTLKKEKVLEEPDGTKMEVKQEEVEESTEKRPGSPRMKKTDSDLEEKEYLKTFLKIVPDEEEIVDYEVLEKRFPIINWESKFYHYDRHGAEGIYYKIFRSDGSSRWIKTFSEMVTRTMFDANEEYELWQNQERWNLKSWDFYENCGVHTLILEDGTEIHMLAERKYPLTKETLEKMMSLKLVAESASDSAYDLLRFIQKQIDDSRSYDGICQKLYGSQLTMLHSKELASPKQTTFGKDFSNPLMVDSLPKTIWLSMHHVIAKKHWLFQSKRLLCSSSSKSRLKNSYVFGYILQVIKKLKLKKHKVSIASTSVSTGSRVSTVSSKLCMTRSSTKELFTPFKDPEQEFRSTRKLFKTPSLDDSSSPEFDLFSDLEDQSKEEVTKAMGEPTMEEYMMKTQEDYGSGVARPKIDDKAHFELKDQFLKELRDYTFSGSDNEDTNEHIEKVLEIVDLFHIPEINQDQIMLRDFPMSLTRAASRWLRNEPPGSIITWEVLKKKFLSKYCPPARIAKKIEEINNFQQEHNETLYQAWEIFKELLMRCPQHYLTDMPEVILYYKGLDVPTRQILDSKGAIPTMKAADAKEAIQEMADHSQKWHNRMSTRARSTKTFDGLAAIQAQLNNHVREIKANEKVYAAQVGCESCGGPYYSKDSPLKE